MHAYALTDIGKTRTANQDYLFLSTEKVGCLPNVFLVADGMGGHKAGDYASRYLIEHLVDYLKDNSDENVALLKKAIETINFEIFNMAQNNEDYSGMGTTLVSAIIDHNKLYIANIGDSRLYIVSNDRITQITHDHSYVEEMVFLGKMKRESEDYKKHKNIITRAVGAAETVSIDFFEEILMPGDYILMCTDGLSNMVDNDTIKRVVCSDLDLEHKVQELISIANNNGGRDNITVVLIDPQVSEVSQC